jgi:hypothetical protein
LPWIHIADAVSATVAALGRGAALAVRLVGTKSNRDAIGAKVTAVAGGKTQVRMVSTAKSYASASEKMLTLGLGDAKDADSVKVTWPDGTTAEALHLGPGNYRWVEGGQPEKK